MNIPPPENVEPIVIPDEPKLKIRLLPKREKRKTTTPDEPDKKKSKIALEASSQEANIVTDVFNREKDNCLNQIIDSEINISPHENLEPIVIQDEPKLKIRLLPKREKRKAKASGELDEKKSKIIFGDATPEANIITDVLNKKEDNCVYQIIDDDPKIKINLLSCRRSLPHSKAFPNKSDVVKNVCESALNKSFGTYKPEIKIHQHLVIRQPNKELNIENITDSTKPKTNIEPGPQDSAPFSDTLQRLGDGIQCAKGVKSDNQVETIVINEEPGIKIKLLPRKMCNVVVEKKVTEQEERNYSFSNEIKSSATHDTSHEESHSTKDEDTIKFNCESQCDFLVNEETIGIVSPKQVEATRTAKEEKSKCKVVNEIVIDDEPKIKINLLSKKRQGKTTSITKTDECEAIKSNNHENKLPKHEESYSIKDEDSIKLNCESQSDFPVNDETFGTVSPKQIEATGTIEEEKNKCKVVNEIVINDEPAIKINLLSKKRQGKTTSITKTDECEAIKSSDNEKKLPRHEESYSIKDEDSIKLYCESQSDFPVNDETIGIVSPKQIEATGTIEEGKNKCKVVNEIVIDDEPTIKINLLSKKRQRKTTSITKTDKCEAVKSRNNEKKLPKHEESHSTKDEDSIELYCESQSDFPVNDETIGSFSPKKIEATVTTEEGKNICKVVNEIVIDEEAKIKINLLSKKRQGKTTSVTKTDECEAIKSNNHENKLAKHKESHSTKDEDSIKLYCESQSDFPVNDETIGIVSPKQIEATTEEEKDKCNVMNEIVIDDEPTIKINLLPKKRQGKTTSITKTDKCAQLPKHEEKMFDDKNETHCKADCSTKGQDSFKSYYESICDVQVSRARTAANFHLSEVESSQETVEKRHITPKPTDNLIKKSCDDLDIVENVETTGINSERTIEVIGSVKEGTNNSINEDNGSLQILIDEDPTIKINLLPKRKQKKTKNDPEAQKSLENEKNLLDNQLRYGVKNDSHWEDTDSMKDQDSSTCLQDIARVAKSGNVEESGLQEAQYNKEVLEKPLALQAAANLFQKSFDISDLTENNEEDIEATIKNELKRVNESNSTLQMVVIYDEPKTKDNLLSKSNKKPLNHFENSKTACKTVDETEDFISSKSFVEDHSKSLLDTFLNLETQYKKLNSILPEVSGDCKDNFEPVTNLVSETLANNIETDEDSEATTDKNDQMETTVNDRHELVQEINDPCDTKEDILARDTDFEKHCDQVDSNVTRTVFSKDEGLEEVEGFGTVNDGINENVESGALLEGNGAVLVSPTEKSYTTVVKRKICYELDEENIQTKDHQDPMVQSACGEFESVELEMPERTEIQDQTDITHNKKKSGSSIEREVSSKIVVIDEEPKIKINFLSRAKKSQLTLGVETKESTLDNVTNCKNEEPIEESVGDKQITKCSEQYLGQKCPTNAVENKGEGKLGCQTDTIVINEEPKIKINFLSKRKKK